ncbi:hypothetical protein KY316_00555, partial [Candidatus Woesearchaeota archaeon]|nr:hypothetical protein [Candidatus Woesearchaeota archaeon]
MSFWPPLIVGILSLFIIMKSAGYAISAISNYARKTGISEYFVGFVIVAIGTSFPDISTAIFASLAKESSMVIGEVMGANIIDTTIVFGLTAIFGGTIFVKEKMITKTILPLLGMVILPAILCLDGVLSRADGIILIVAFAIYMYFLVLKEGTLGHMKKSIPLKDIWKDIIVFGGTLAALLLAARWFVLSAISLSHILNVPVFLMGLLFVSLGTTLPEITVNLKSVLRNHSGIAFGDVLGSVLVNITLVLGIGAIIAPIEFDRFRLFVNFAIMLFGVILGLLFIKGKKITWKHG